MICRFRALLIVCCCGGDGWLAMSGGNMASGGDFFGNRGGNGEVAATGAVVDMDDGRCGFGLVSGGDDPMGGSGGFSVV
ncbi:unnamed protein product [Dovyalis caffra]|uniref:Secreted protein n=1 Tax=Dovyalis caffra TaxID=77055 RepID=A0AAV1RUD2_9ROSI|nr:unnamed protein product [Dovyalis caffra]